MKNKRGFTLIELLVAMTIIGILIALAIFGIIQVQRNSRDTQRRKALEDVNIGIQEFYSKYGQYPDGIVFNGETATIATAGLGNEVVELKNSAQAAGATTNNTTEYAYDNGPADGYRLAACLENGEVENAGTSVASDYSHEDFASPCDN